MKPHVLRQEVQQQRLQITGIKREYLTTGLLTVFHAKKKLCWSGKAKTLQILKIRWGKGKSVQIILLEDELAFFSTMQITYEEKCMRFT